jgi:Lrp/AsnC family leucine-responsive transcriptional regulator
MDQTDREILKELRRNGRISFSDLGRQVGLSPNAAAARVERLQKRGVIRGFTAIIDPGAGGDRLAALVEVQLAAGTAPDECERVFEELPTIVEAMHVTGRFDYELRVICRDPGELDRTIRALKERAGVVATDTRIVLRTAVERASSA